MIEERDRAAVGGPEGRMNAPVIWSLFLVHFIGDLYMSFVSPLLPVLAEKLSLSMTRVGLVTGVSLMMAFVIQPSVGYLSDRYRTRLFVLGGPLLTAVFIPLFGWAGGLASLLVFAALGSIGQSMFHPQAAGMVPAHAGGRLGFSMAVFILGGTVAFGVGPVLVAWYVSRFGLSALPFTSLLGVAVVAGLFVLVPLPVGERLQKRGFIGSIKEILGPVWKPLFILWLLIVFRVYVVQSFLTFAPVLMTREHYALIAVGAVVSVFVVAGAISSLAAGHMADRIGYKPVFYGSYLLTSPCLFFFIKAEGHWIFVGSFLAGFFTLATLPLATAMAQILVRRGQSLVASLTMGLAFGFGGLLTPLTGRMADAYGIRPVLSVVCWLPLLAAVLIRYLPETGDKAGG